jgi:hypothetical protein
VSIEYLKGTFEKSADEIAKDCRRIANLSRRCEELAAQ